MKNYRPHRFPPLPQLGTATNRLPGISAGAAAGDWQSSLAEGYEQGRNEGYEAGKEQGRREGYEAGRSEGVQQGREEGRNETLVSFDSLASPLEAMLTELKSVQEDYQTALRKEVVDLVAKVARQVIRCELALQPAQLLALVDETLAAMPPVREGVEVYLNPAELQRILEVAPERARNWQLIPDPRLEAGECRVKAGDHEADAGCRQRLAACIEQLGKQLLEETEIKSDVTAGAEAVEQAEKIEKSSKAARAVKAPRIKTAKIDKADKVSKAAELDTERRAA